ncbi:MAG TPA: type II secretion system protein [Polyangiaceae bacterium]|nr:type II secretion system protein [Polyangiaceae bacterium]
MKATRGFTLLEVLVAIAILGLGLTAILSAQTGMFASSIYAEHVSSSIGLLRCRMSEIEVKLAKEGYPLVDQTDQGTCCGDEPQPGYKCKWKIEKVELPLPPTMSDMSSKTGAMGGMGALGAIASVGQSNGSVLGQAPGLGDVSRLLAGQAPAGVPTSGSPLGGPDSFGPSALGGGMLGGGAGASPFAGGTSSLAPLVMSFVYPTLKPMLEASIRKVTVTVEWKDGERTRDVQAVQFLTNPQQGGLDPNAAQGLDAITSMLGIGQTGSGSGKAPAAGAK